MKTYEELSNSPEVIKSIQETYGVLAASINLNIDDHYMDQLLEGCYDTHIHAGPDSFGRRPLTEAEVAKKGVDKGMGGLVFKCQPAPSSAREVFVQEIADRYAEDTGKKKLKVFSGVCLSKEVGGINPAAVEASFHMGGKYVWTPSKQASHHCKVTGSKDPGIAVCDENGNLIPEMYDIFKLIAENDGILGMSHQSTNERFLMIQEAKKLGVQKIVCEHVHMHVTKLSIEQMKEMADMGVYLGLCYCACVPNYIIPKIDRFEAAETIKAIGTCTFIGQTDLQQLQTPDPVEGTWMFAKMLLSQGITEEQIRTMFIDNPKQLLY